ncbi:MAG: hypothetical protein M3036_04000, partial [Bifidobacteriales bacterium]|nr:hypothetical protein [Bifidobacteriales bacterium]
LSNFAPESLYSGDRRWMRRLTDVRHLTRETLPDMRSLAEHPAERLDVFGDPIPDISSELQKQIDAILEEDLV